MTGDELLAEYAHPSRHRADRDKDMWFIGDPWLTRSRADTIGLIRAQLTLGVPVSDTFTAEAFTALVDRVLLLERMQDRRLNAGPPT